MATWDVFHSDRLELERGLDASSIHQALARGELRDDDLVRPSGTAVPWSRIAEVPDLIAPVAPEPAPPPAPTPSNSDEAPKSDFEEVLPSLDEVARPPTTPGRQHQPTEMGGPASTSDVAFPVLDEPIAPQAPPHRAPEPESAGWIWGDDDDDDDDEGDEEAVGLEDREDVEILSEDALSGAPVEKPQAERAYPVVPDRRKSPDWEPGVNDFNLDERPDSRSSHVALPVVRSRDRESPGAAEEELDPEASFSLSRSATAKVEELDLAPMVDVAFNLVLFFMVTASTILYKTLEIPKPSGEAPAEAVAQGRSRTMDDLKDDYILVEIDEVGATKLDREPIEPTMANLVELLRRARERTGRKSMLLSANFATPHRNAVLAYDAANEIGLGIAIAKPQPPLGPAPALRSGPAAVPTKPAPASAAGPPR